MSRIYTDYVNKIALSIPDEFIDVKTGVSRRVSMKIQEQIEYHTDNGTLSHLLFSALHQYLKPKSGSGMNEEVLCELLEIKRMIERGGVPMSPALKSSPAVPHAAPKAVDLREVEDILDAFGG